MKLLLTSYHLNGHTLGVSFTDSKVIVTTFIDSRFDSGSERVNMPRIPEGLPSTPACFLQLLADLTELFLDFLSISM